MSQFSNHAAEAFEMEDTAEYDPREALHAAGYAAGIAGRTLALTLEEAHATLAWEFDALICGFGEGVRDLTNYQGDMANGWPMPEDPFA